MRHHYIVPYGPYLAADNVYVSLVVASQSDWQRMASDVFERPELLSDERFLDAPARRTNRIVLDAIVESIVGERPSIEWFARLRAAGLPHGRVRGMADALAHPQVEARQLIREVDSPVGRIPTIESPLRMSESPVRRAGIPELGGDTNEVLRSAGYSAAEIEAFRASGVIGGDVDGRSPEGEADSGPVGGI
jgi:crotonobetainyl-CoA:carnitine CoA-transferase CaiB-like acyl-CoA transferase